MKKDDIGKVDKYEHNLMLARQEAMAKNSYYAVWDGEKWVKVSQSYNEEIREKEQN